MSPGTCCLMILFGSLQFEQWFELQDYHLCTVSMALCLRSFHCVFVGLHRRDAHVAARQRIPLGLSRASDRQLLYAFHLPCFRLCSE